MRMKEDTAMAADRSERPSCQRRCQPAHLVSYTAFVLALGLVGATPLAAQIPPDAHWQTIESAHFRVTFSPGLEQAARHVAARAEITHEVLSRELGRAPRGRIDIVLTGEVDVANGFASVFPSNRIVLFAHAPLDNFALEFHADWLDLLVTHELTHIFHLDATSALGRALRSIFGRVPAGWPFFPVIGTPTWSIEGLAVQAESHLTGMGRLHGSFHEMVVRTAVLEGQFDPIDRVSNHTPIWPDGQRPYIYGSLYMDFLQRRYGADAPARVLDRTARSWFPPPLAFNHVGRRALGEPFTRAFRAWQAELDTHYAALAASLAAEGLTESERIVGHGRFALSPRVSPDGRRIAYAAGDGREALMTRIVGPNGDVAWQRRRSSLGAASWLPDGSALITSQLDLVDPYRMFEDLYIVSPRGERRLTRGARLMAPDIARDGRRVVAIEGRGETGRVVIYDLETGAITPLHDFATDVNWAAPRWSPDGTRIAVSRWRQGGDYDLVVLDAAGTVLREITSDRAIDGTPAWSPDGRHLIFSSDRTGIPNLYAAEPGDDGTHALYRITNVLTGAVHPEVTPDGRSIIFVRYHADGFHIDRMPFDPATWRPAEPLALERIAELRAPGLAPDTLRRDERVGVVDTTASPVAPYRAARSARPHFWVPYIDGDTVTGTFVGLFMYGRDLVGRHEWDLAGGVDFDSGRWQGSVAYSFAGLGRPVIDVRAEREWLNRGINRFLVQSPTDEPPDTVERTRLDREDLVSLALRFPVPRFRSSASFAIGGEYVNRRIELVGTPRLRLADERDDLVGAVARAAYARYRFPAFAISPQDGFVISTLARRRWDVSVEEGHPDRSYSELTGFLTAYRSLELFGFARHVLAARATGLWRGGERAPFTTIGGEPGRRLLAVRGYAPGTLAGTTGWSASAEYRMPIALVGRGYRIWPIFLDRVSATAFVDAGAMSCNPGAARVRPTECARLDRTLAGAGGELILDTVLLFVAPVRLRYGIAAPIAGGGTGVRAYVQTGLAF
jgi:hypothetical protein